MQNQEVQAAAARLDAAIAVLDDPESEGSEAEVEHAERAYVRILTIPAQTFSDVRMKLAAIMRDADCGLVDVDGLALIARDLDALIGGAVQ